MIRVIHQNEITNPHDIIIDPRFHLVQVDPFDISLPLFPLYIKAHCYLSQTQPISSQVPTLKFKVSS